MSNRENKVEVYLKRRIKELGGLSRKWVSPMHRGVPDQIVIVKGIVIFVECKTQDGELEKHQIREIEKLDKAGANTVVVYGRRGVDDLIENIKNATGQILPVIFDEMEG